MGRSQIPGQLFAVDDSFFGRFLKPPQCSGQELHIQGYQQEQVRPEKESTEAIEGEVAKNIEENDVGNTDRQQEKDRHCDARSRIPYHANGFPCIAGLRYRFLIFQESPSQESLGEGEKDKVVRPGCFQDKRDCQKDQLETP